MALSSIRSLESVLLYETEVIVVSCAAARLGARLAVASVAIPTATRAPIPECLITTPASVTVLKLTRVREPPNWTFGGDMQGVPARQRDRPFRTAPAAPLAGCRIAAGVVERAIGDAG